MFNLKKIIVTLSLIGTLCLPISDLFSKINNPKKVSIVFDLHDVLFEPDYKQHLTILSILGAGAALTYGAYNYFGSKALGLIFAGATTVVLDLLNSFRKQTYRHEENAFKNGYLTPYLLPIYIKMESVFKPNKEMVKLVKNLKDDGYKLTIASNINDGSLDLLKERYKDGKEFNFGDFADILSPTKENDYLNKRYKKDKNDTPGQAYFQKLADLNQDAELVIYIDDKKKNCTMAEKVIGDKCKTFEFKNKTVNDLTQFINDKIVKAVPNEDTQNEDTQSN